MGGACVGSRSLGSRRGGGHAWSDSCRLGPAVNGCRQPVAWPQSSQFTPTTVPTQALHCSTPRRAYQCRDVEQVGLVRVLRPNAPVLACGSGDRDRAQSGTRCCGPGVWRQMDVCGPRGEGRRVVHGASGQRKGQCRVPAGSVWMRGDGRNCRLPALRCAGGHGESKRHGDTQEDEKENVGSIPLDTFLTPIVSASTKTMLSATTDSTVPEAVSGYHGQPLSQRL
eukprot:356034-Chlamydomonas_euryale.AAC.2